MTSLSSSSPAPRDFALYLWGLAATAIGDAVTFVALPFVVLAGGGQGALGAVVLAGSLPRFLAPLLGTLADRWPPRAVLSGAALLRALLLGVVALLALHGHAALPALAASGFLNGLLVTLSFTAGSALTPRLVAPDALARANSLSSAALMGLPLVGYGLGGLLVKVLGSPGTLLVGLPLYALSALTALALQRQAAPCGAHGEERFWTQLRGGLSVVRAQPLLMLMLLLGFSMNLALNVVNVRAPLFMQREAGGAGGYALFEGLLSGGALLGALAVGPLARRWSPDTLITSGRVACALAVAGLALPDARAWFSAAGLLGLSLGVLEVAAITRIQSLAPQGALGRVMGVGLGLNALGLSIGAALGGAHLPGPPLFVALAALLAALGLLWPRLAP